MKKIVCLLCFVLSVMCLMSSCSKEEKNNTIKIGSVHPLTGNMAYEGQAIVNAQQLAVDEINKNGGINGKMVELITSDSQGVASKAAVCAQKLLSKGVCALTGTYTSGTAQVVSLEAEKEKIPLVITVASSSTLLSRGFKYTFRIQPSVNTFAENFIEYFKAIKTEDIKRAVLVYEDSNYGGGISAYIAEHINETGLEIAGEISYSASASSLSSEVTKILSLKPDVLITVGYYSDQALLTKELLERNADIPAIVGVANGAYCDPKFTAQYGDRVNGFVDVNYRYNPNSEKTQQVLKAYKEKYGEDIPVHAIYGYESVMVIADAIKRAGSENPEAIRNALANSDIKAHILPQGSICFDEKGENINSAGLMVQIQNGKRVVIYPEEYADGKYIRKEKLK